MIFSIEAIEKSYDRPVLKKISYQFEAGKLYVLKGVSGCGKSTLLNILGGVEKDFEGNVRLDGRDAKKGELLRSAAGYTFQYSLLLSNITVMENLCLIKNDVDRILQLSQEFDVLELLDKYPEQLSGGERQRISVIRALLLDPEIFLADEPTASLDENNSMSIAQYISHLKEKGKIVIVATHEPYFDEAADEILYLNYGKLENIEKKQAASCKKGAEKTDKESMKRLSDQSGHSEKKINLFHYTLRRNPGLLNIFSLLPFLFVFLLILFVSTLQNSFEDEYMRSVKGRYPVDAFNINISEARYEAFPFKDKIQFYDCYTAKENEVTAFYLAAKEDSVLAINGMLEFGSFPEQEDEVLVSHELAERLYGENADFESCIGEKLIFCGEEFVIRGILFSLDESRRGSGANKQFELYYNSDIYYRRTEGELLYIPYETIKQFGELVDAETKRGYYRNLFDDMAMVEALRNLQYGSVNEFDEEIRMAQHYVNIISVILLLVFFASFFMACIFISTQIQIELFYKRRELGFLQIFGLTKKEICRITFPKYIIRMAASFVLALLLYGVLIGIFFLFRGHLVFANIIHVLLVFAAVFILYFVFTAWTLRHFLRQDIIQLITG